MLQDPAPRNRHAAWVCDYVDRQRRNQVDLADDEFTLRWNLRADAAELVRTDTGKHGLMARRCGQADSNLIGRWECLLRLAFEPAHLVFFSEGGMMERNGTLVSNLTNELE